MRFTTVKSSFCILWEWMLVENSNKPMLNTSWKQYSHTKPCVKICNKDQASTQALKGHIRSKHMDATPWKCNQCDKFFGDNSTYKSHLKIHQQPNQHKCDVCNKGYPSLSRLNAHKKVHDPSTYVNCKWCNKEFKNKKNLPAHEKTCKRQPGGRDAAVRDKKCPYCDSAYFHQKDLKHHISEKHKSRAHQKQ